MQKLLASGAAALLVWVLGGCAVEPFTPGLGEESGSADLSGLTLLESDEADCDGMVQVDSDPLEDDGDGLGGEFFVQAGQNTVFELDDDEEDMDWACVSEDGDSDVETLECPDGATHVRITRAGDGGEVLFECYGV